MSKPIRHSWLIWLDEITDYLYTHKEMHPSEEMVLSMQKLNASIARSMRLKLEREAKK